MTNSTVSSESAPRSSMNLASGVTWSAFTPNCSTMISFTRCSIVFSAMIYSGSKLNVSGSYFCSVSMRRFGTRQAPNRKKLHGHAAINRKHLAGDITSGRTSQKQDGIGDVVRLAEAAQGDLFQEPLARLGADFGRHGGLNETGGDGVHRDAAARQFSGDGLGKADHARFAGAVIALAGVADQADHRSDVNDSP